MCVAAEITDSSDSRRVEQTRYRGAVRAVQLKCPNCGATFDVAETAISMTCRYCGQVSRIQQRSRILQRPQVPEGPTHLPVVTRPARYVALAWVATVGVATVGSAGTWLASRNAASHHAVVSAPEPEVPVQAKQPVAEVATAPTPAEVPAARPPPSDGWIERRTLGIPDGLDPHQIQVERYIAYALAQATRAVPDARLIGIEVSGVGPDGVANLELWRRGGSKISLQFVSPARGKRERCKFGIDGDGNGGSIYPIDGKCTDDDVAPPPQCTIAELWKRAIARKAPVDAVATFRYSQNSVTRRAAWYASIDSAPDRPTYRLSEQFYDTCGAGAGRPRATAAAPRRPGRPQGPRPQQGAGSKQALEPQEDPGPQQAR